MRRITVILAATLLALTVMGPAWGAGPPDHETSDVFAFVDDEPIEGAIARLIRGDSGVGFTLSTSGLEKGHAVSIWWVIFNDPDHCAGDPCEVTDLFNPDVNAAVQAGGGHVIAQAERRRSPGI